MQLPRFQCLISTPSVCQSTQFNIFPSLSTVLQLHVLIRVGWGNRAVYCKSNFISFKVKPGNDLPCADVDRRRGFFPGRECKLYCS